jgi:hypothetical protein
LVTITEEADESEKFDAIASQADDKAYSKR